MAVFSNDTKNFKQILLVKSITIKSYILFFNICMTEGERERGGEGGRKKENGRRKGREKNVNNLYIYVSYMNNP